MESSTVTIIGFVAAVCTTASFLPQVIKTFKTRHTADISLLMYAILTFGIIMWLTYGIILKNPPIIFANSVSLVLASIVLVLKIKHG